MRPASVRKHAASTKPRASASGPTPTQQLDLFLSRYTPEIAATARSIHAALKKKFPTAVNLVYDNYNALVIGFGPTEKPSEAFLSIAIYPAHLTLCFLHGAKLKDPARRLKGSGNQVRSLRLIPPETLNEPAVQQLMDQAAEQAGLSKQGPSGPLVIRSISAKQRPRRPQA